MYLSPQIDDLSTTVKGKPFWRTHGRGQKKRGRAGVVMFGGCGRKRACLGGPGSIQGSEWTLTRKEETFGVSTGVEQDVVAKQTQT